MIKQDRMRKQMIFAITTLVLIFSGCSTRQTALILNDVESYIMERPDSALVVLDSIDRGVLTTDRLKAHHALLHAMALDKNFIDVTDDSLAGVALNYYSRKGPEKNEARAQYYLGLSYYYAGDYNKAILEFTKAEKVAERSDSLYWGFVKMLQASTYAKTYNEIEACEHFKQANAIYTSLSEKYYINVSELSLARSYINNDEFVSADSILCRLIEDEDVDSKIRYSAMAERAFALISKLDSQYNDVISLYENIIDDKATSVMTLKHYWTYAYALEKAGRYNVSQPLISQLSQIDTSGNAYYWRYRIAQAHGNIPESLLMLEQSVTKNNTEVTDMLKQSLALSQRDYYESQFRESSLKIRVKNQVIIFVFILSVLIILVIVLCVQKYLSEHRKEKENLLEYVEEISRQLSQYKDEDYPMLKKRFISLYKSRFETLGTLCGQYLQDRNRDDIEKVMFQKVILLIEDIRNDKVRKAKFESVLDAELDGIMTRFRNEIPKCKEWEVTMFGYLVAGFDSTTISRLMNLSLDQVYSYKRRLIHKIENKNPEHVSQFLEMLT